MGKESPAPGEERGRGEIGLYSPTGGAQRRRRVVGSSTKHAHVESCGLAASKTLWISGSSETGQPARWGPGRASRGGCRGVTV